MPDLTESQRVRIEKNVGLAAALLTEVKDLLGVKQPESKRDDLEIGADVMGEVEQLRKNQRELHAAGKNEGASLDEKAAINRWQGIARAAKGNLETITKEMQKYLTEGVLPGKNKKQ